MAAYTLLILKPPFPDDSISTTLTSSFPELIGHAQRVFDIALHPSKPARKTQPPETRTISSIASLVSWKLPTGRVWAIARKHKDTEEEKKYKKLRWQLYGAAAAAILGWVIVVGAKLTLRLVGADDVDEEEDEEDEEDVIDEDEDEDEDEDMEEDSN